MRKAFLSITLGLLAVLISKCHGDNTTLTKIGDMAPVFSCTTIDGNKINIGKLKGKIILINFFATWCPPCNLELPVLQKEVWGKYKDNQDFVLIILGREHSEQEIKDFVTAKEFTMPFASDPKREIFKLYASQNIPRNVIIGRDGKILFQSTGYNASDFKKMESLLASYLNE